MPNPYYIKPATPDITPFATGLGSLVQQTLEKKRQQQAQQEVSDALATNDPHQIADAAIKHPELSQAASAAFGFTNDATKKAATEAYRQVLTDPANASQYLQQGIDEVKKFGGNPVMMAKDLQEFQVNPKGALDSVKMGYASIDPNGWKSISSGAGGIGTLSPELTKAISLSYVDPSQINKGNIGMYEQLAKSGALVNNNKRPSDALITSIRNGEIDPKFVNSRTIPFYNAIAKKRVNATRAHATASAKTKAVEDLTRYAASANSVLSALDKNMPLLVQSADRVNQLGTPIVDKFKAETKAKFSNDPDVIQYTNTLNAVRSEYARMLAKGGVPTEKDKDEAKIAVPAGLSSKGYESLLVRLKAEGQNILDANNEAASAIHFGKPGGAMIQRPETSVDSVTVGGQTYNRPANFTDEQWAAYKQSVGAQ